MAALDTDRRAEDPNPAARWRTDETGAVIWHDGSLRLRRLPALEGVPGERFAWEVASEDDEAPALDLGASAVAAGW